MTAVVGPPTGPWRRPRPKCGTRRGAPVRSDVARWSLESRARNRAPRDATGRRRDAAAARLHSSPWPRRTRGQPRRRGGPRPRGSHRSRPLGPLSPNPDDWGQYIDDDDLPSSEDDGYASTVSSCPRLAGEFERTRPPSRSTRSASSRRRSKRARRATRATRRRGSTASLLYISSSPRIFQMRTPF